MSIPISVQVELEAAVCRTGLTPQLARAGSVLRAMFDCTPTEVEEVFWIQGQADAIVAAHVSDEMEEVEYVLPLGKP